MKWTQEKLWVQRNENGVLINVSELPPETDRFIWHGREINTVGDIMGAIESIDTPEQAQEFMQLYRSRNEHADANIGYISGYYSLDRASRIRELFGVSHRIFGNTNPTAEEAFEAGKKIAAGQGD